jgi:DNA primase
MVRQTALAVRDLLDELGIKSYPKTSGSRGIHINVRVEPKWDFGQVRRCALAIGREVERRHPDMATTKCWKEERRGVFIDYNQNARDRTVASAYSVRPLPDARVSYPLTWDEVADVDPAEFTLRTVPTLFAARGDAHAGIDDEHFSLEPLLGLVERHESEGMAEAPYPPQFPKAAGEPPRVQPSRRKKAR